MSVQNADFIFEKCFICDNADLVMSELKLTCNYGSKHDGETVTINICSDCADIIYNNIKE